MSEYKTFAMIQNSFTIEMPFTKDFKSDKTVLFSISSCGKIFAWTHGEIGMISVVRMISWDPTLLLIIDTKDWKEN